MSRRSRTEPPARPAALEPGGAAATPWIVAGLFALGLVLRLPAFTGPHLEGDEVLYHGLVHQIDAGRGYNLVGLDLPDQTFPSEQFGQRLFYHPPGGIVLFWAFWKFLGAAGFGAAQLAAYAVFFFALRAFAGRVLGPPRPIVAIVTAALAAATPIAVHVSTKHWLDGPVLAATTLAAVAWLSALGRRSPWRSIGAGALLGLASLVKTTAFVALPGMLLVAWALGERRWPDRRWLGCAALAVLTALAVQAPWELWQWRVLGSPFPYWAGKPVERLVSDNPYIWFVTVHRSPLVYLQLLPITVWTSLPVLIALVGLGPGDARRRVVFALAGWAAVVVGAHVGLGAMGYSKLLRYIILAAPALITLAAWAADRLAPAAAAAAAPRPGGGQPRRASKGRSPALVLLSLLFAAGVVLEVSQGISAATEDPRIHMVVSLLDRLGWIEQP